MQLTTLSLLSLTLCTTLAAQDTGTSYLFQVPKPVPPGVRATLQQGFDVLHGETADDGSMQVVVLPEELAAFKAVVPNAQFVRRGRPFADIYREMLQRMPEPPDPLYYTTAEIEAEITNLMNANPALALKVDLNAMTGAPLTHNGKTIWALKISDNVAQDEDEPAMVIIAQHHARELNAPHMVIGAARRLLSGYATDPQIKAAVDGHELYFVPTVNVDGVDHVWCCDDFWRKNRRNNGNGTFGVDNNRNYPTLWGSCGSSSTTSSQTYRGPSPASEPETQTMRALIAALRPEVYIDFHSSGQEVLFTYPPCGTASTPIRNFLNVFINDLRNPMSYATRAPSASGEAPEDHWNSGGALSLLIEVGTSFQPSFSVTVNEEARVWPGLRQVLTTWKSAVRGHVRSIYQGQPVEATITFTPNQFSHGETTRSRARDGRYGLWLPTGSWNVTWSAAGFQSVTRPVTVSSYNNPQTMEIEMIPNWQPSTLVLSGSNRIGTTTSMTYTSPGDAGRLYWIALSGGTSPGIPVGSRTVPLNGDALMVASLSAAPLLTNNLATLGGGGQATAQFNIPSVPALAGVTVYTAGITFESGYPDGVKKWSPAQQITILP